jgi:ketosteroid isomerase-like protein
VVTDIRSTIEDLEDRRYQAMIDSDLAVLRELCSDDLVYTHSNAERDTKASYLEKVESGFYVYEWIEHPVQALLVSGDCAIVVGEMRASVINNGEPRKLDNACLAVWVRTSSGWRFTAYQPTPKPA